MKSTFLSALAQDGAINEAEISKESLNQSYAGLQKQVRESIAKQESLLSNIQVNVFIFIGYSFIKYFQSSMEH